MTLPISRDAVAAGDGALSTCTAATGGVDREVVDELAVGGDRLGAHARGRGLEVGPLYFRNESLDRRSRTGAG